MQVRAAISKRRADFEQLCRSVDFEGMQLLDDTMTEVFIKRDGDESRPVHIWDFITCDDSLRVEGALSSDCEFAPYVGQLRFCLRKDPFHVRYPPYDFHLGVPTKELSDISKTRELGWRVYEIRLSGDDRPYIYKQMESPHYHPQESVVLNQELQNLQQFRGVEGIVQLVAAVISQNPYRTLQLGASNISINGSTKSTDQVVLRGFVLQYHPNGTLQGALQDSNQETIRQWRKWAFQISLALLRFHERGLAHMDLKPSNIVFDAEYNAVLIDISGIGGITREYTSPEMLNLNEPLDEKLEARMRNDIWALGKMISEMADASTDYTEKDQLKSIALGATTDDPSSRTPLSSIVSSLAQSGPVQHQ
jgi:serine/threonine protein kinase